MKKGLKIFVVCLVILTLTGCAKKETGDIVPETQTVPEVDYDLTVMNGDMVYAMIFQMMMDPATYTGKTFKVEGNYYSGYSEETKQYYHFCIIQDALACCAQGLEFVWDDGSHVYPDEYPPEEAKIIVEGVFETYMEEGDSNLYCHLKDAKLLVEEVDKK